MTRWQKWWGLTWADRWLLLQAAAMLAWVSVRAQSMSFRPELDGRRSAGPTHQDVARAENVARLVRMAGAGLPVRAACLQRSIVLWVLLRREGIECSLRLGAADPATGPFEAHAWVECAGIALGEVPGPLARYRPFNSAVVPVLRRWTLPRPEARLN